ncbi:thiamine pyrophosphate-binding protein [Aeromicrobium piscarium]|uniref:Thiamine pyrophosphate-binding protein n=1 Tax=Aeromicrobium piscarium TaxID=2590901 RepID=A0A554RP55_9ACTN|nr:thiamine pyrophosphate-binding protein [Aeromicrobium piscarium]TSD55831.1 thiamine pyrophosphate-binding protein [Aeromicrobium piscarium]
MSDPQQPTGGDILVDVMRRHGVEVAFGVVSIHNLPLVEAVDRELRFVPVRHEAAAVNAADGYARATGRFGVAITSTGTGAGNAAGSMLEALSAGSRVLHITGQIDSEHLGSGRGVIHEVPRQLQMLESISRFARTVEHVDDAERVLEDAIADLQTLPHAPASIEWPIDLQYLGEPERQVAASPVIGEPRSPEDDEIEAAAALLRSARRPLLWAGGGARTIGAPLRELIERVGAGLLTSNAGRGSVPEDHSLVLGNFASNPGLDELIGDADLLLSIGTHFRSNETRSYHLPLPQTQIAIDVDAAAIGRVYPAEVGLVGDAAEIVPRLLAALGDDAGAEAGWTDRVTATREKVRTVMTENIGAYGDICAAIDEVLPTGSIIARDVTIPSSSWGNRLLPIVDPRSNIFPLGGGIGQGLAMGIGAAVGRPDVPTLIMAGDGGLVVHLGEMATLAGEAPWCVLVIFNDGGYGVLRNLQEAHSGERHGVDLFTPDFGDLASALALPYALARDADEFRSALHKAVDLRAPMVIEVDVTALSPTPAPFVPPVHVPERPTAEPRSKEEDRD